MGLTVECHCEHCGYRFWGPEGIGMLYAICSGLGKYRRKTILLSYNDVPTDKSIKKMLRFSIIIHTKKLAKTKRK